MKICTFSVLKIKIFNFFIKITFSFEILKEFLRTSEISKIKKKIKVNSV
jgi:hypothetical protein